MVTASFPLVSAETTPTDVMTTAPYDADGILTGNPRYHHVTSYRTLPPLRVITSQSDTPTSGSLLRHLNHVEARWKVNGVIWHWVTLNYFDHTRFIRVISFRNVLRTVNCCNMTTNRPRPKQKMGIGRVSYITIYLCYFCFRWRR